MASLIVVGVIVASSGLWGAHAAIALLVGVGAILLGVGVWIRVRRLGVEVGGFQALLLTRVFAAAIVVLAAAATTTFFP